MAISYNKFNIFEKTKLRYYWSICMKRNRIKLLCISIYLLIISCDNNLLNQGNQNDVDSKNNDSDNIHLLTGVISSQNYSSDSNNFWLTISDPSIQKNESMAQIQFKSPGEDMYAVYTEWPIPPENFYTEIKTIYQSSMSISSDSKTQYKYIEIPQITQSIIDSGAVLVYYEIESGEWWGAPFTHSIDIDDNLINIDYAMHYAYMFSLGTLYI